MNIDKSFNNVSGNNKKVIKPAFKAMSPALRDKMHSLENPTKHDSFVKLSSVLGLTSLVAWVNSLKKDNTEKTKANLDIVDSNWSQKSNKLFLDSNTQERYLDVVSKADSAESMIWAKGLLDKDYLEVKGKNISEDEKELFLSPEKNETYMSISANNVLNSVLKQVEALSGADDETKKQTIKNIELKLSYLVKQAEELKNSEETAEIYEKVSNILKSFAVSNFIELEGNDSSENAVKDETLESEELPVIEDAVEALSDASIKVLESTSIKDMVEDLDYVAAEEAKEYAPQVKIINHMDLSGVTKRRRIAKNTEQPTEKTLSVDNSQKELKPIPLNSSNREFVNNTFLPCFSEGASVAPEIYSDNIDFIHHIYDSLPKDNDKVRASFLKLLKSEDLNEKLTHYRKLSKQIDSNFNFLNYLYFEKFLESNGKQLSQADYDKLANYHDNSVIYIQANLPNKPKYASSIKEEPNLRIAFKNTVSTNERMKIIADVHRMAFGLGEDDLLSSEKIEQVTKTDILKELVNKITYRKSDYKNIVNYLGLKDEIDDIIAVRKDEGLKAAIDAMEERLDTRSSTKLNELADILNNESFKDLLITTHSRMRFIERFVFDIPVNITKTHRSIKYNTTSAINYLKRELSHSNNIVIKNYSTENLSKDNVKSGAQVELNNNTIIGLDAEGHIHTIY